MSVRARSISALAASFAFWAASERETDGGCCGGCCGGEGVVVVIAVAVFARVVSMRSFFARGSSSVVLVIGVRWLVETNGVLSGEWSCVWVGLNLGKRKTENEPTE